ncbi:hypothetical protein HN592_02570 [Candidatus Woesearchaeota archaeon]|jgi:hypothetical protein|nr:hypothetical protein [Candidatus Woesearchaeota archaeon]MBT4368096.1 hypothetical protein [Candidatus Woesearchaeota archaeon]MBT4712584.1 hypothetical protein [Candidatus Woesearchaeota archaeon]MBT6639497.1 hypothetical protein [Candidatus Woesearchaeota archaeon]MBT7133669.1 hypothetical protein [Candidatus Woesearchaeota archaeon]
MNEDYEIIPLKEVKKLKDEIERLKKEKAGSPAFAISNTLERLASSLEKLFQLFEVAATEIEHDKIEEKSFEEKVQPVIDKMNVLEDQNRDIAEGILALADIIKKQPRPVQRPINPPMPEPRIPAGPEPIFNDFPAPSLPPPPGNMPPPPPMKEKKGFFK